MSTEAAIKVTALVKTFGQFRALDELDLEVAPAEVHGFLGPNGAGKSTTIRALLGLVRANSGQMTLLGGDPWRDATTLHQRIATVPGDVSLWPSLSGGEAIDALLGLRRASIDRARRDQLIKDFDLDPRKKCKAYSKGNRQKVALIAAFAAPADLYILDEPTSGLDPLMEQIFREQVRRVKADGATVLLSSHILAEVEELCDRVTIIRAGRRVDHGTLTELRHLSRTTVSYLGRPLTDARVSDVVAVAQAAEQRVSFTVADHDLPAILYLLAEERVTQLTMSQPSLEELFLRHYAVEESR